MRIASAQMIARTARGAPEDVRGQSTIVPQIAVWSEANAPMLCAAPGADGSARNAARFSSSDACRSVTGVCGRLAKAAASRWNGPIEGRTR